MDRGNREPEPEIVRSDYGHISGRGELIVSYIVDRKDEHDGHEVDFAEAHQIADGIYKDYENRIGIPVCMTLTFCEGADAWYIQMFEGYKLPKH